MTNSIKPATSPHKNRLIASQTQAVMIDIQERLAPHIDGIDQITQKTITLITGLQILQIPIMLNEQYPQGLGKTLDHLKNQLNPENQTIFEKHTFSLCDTPQSWQHLQKQAQNRPNILLFGTETHVCVQQTALDLLDLGLRPTLIVDATGSRHATDKAIALNRMQQAGVLLTSTESILFELCRSSQSPHFKAISQLVK